MGINRDDIRVTADPVFTFKLDDDALTEPGGDMLNGQNDDTLGVRNDDMSGKFDGNMSVELDGDMPVKSDVNISPAWKLLKQEGIPDDKPFVAVSLRSWMNMPGFQQKIADICDSVFERYGVNIVFINMQIPNDTVISAEVRKKMKRPSYTLENVYTTEQMMGIVKCAEAVISMRLHALIFAASVGVPALGIIYDPKVKYQLEALHMPSLGNVESFDTGRALIAIDEVMNNLSHYRDVIAKQSKIYYEKAKQNDILLEKLIVSGKKHKKSK